MDEDNKPKDKDRPLILQILRPLLALAVAAALAWVAVQSMQGFYGGPIGEAPPGKGEPAPIAAAPAPPAAAPTAAAPVQEAQKPAPESQTPAEVTATEPPPPTEVTATESAPPAEVTAAEPAPPAAEAQPEVATDTAAEAAAPPVEEAPLAAAPPEPSQPSFDIVRIDSEGAGLVAGRAEPGTRVRVLAGDAELANVEVSSTGEFVAFIQTPDSSEGQTLSLQAADAVEATDSLGEGQSLLVLPVAAEDESPLDPVVLDASNDGVRVVQPSGLGEVQGVTLDTINYDAAGAVVLSGRAPALQPIRIYVDDQPIAVARTDEDGTWISEVEGVAEGVYRLRVDALEESGKVASRAESPFQRVIPTAEQLNRPTRVTVQPGNSLWVLARERYGEGILYTQIFAANREAIRDPDLIYPGQIFDLPTEEELAR